MLTFHKTRIAPTPSGFLHLGNVFSFALTASLARKNGANVFLRIDDIDRQRVHHEYIQDIFDTLAFLHIPIDEGPGNLADFQENYSQIHRMSLYQAALDQLRTDGLLFACNCSRSSYLHQTCTCRSQKISLDAHEVNWRLITSPNAAIAVKSYHGQAVTARLPLEMQNFIVRKKDGFPSYQLCSVIDDLFYDVDLIVRGQDLWPSTLAQHVLAVALGHDQFQDIYFYHHLLIEESPGKKLSKSAGATSIRHLKQGGRTSADVYTLITAMLGSNQRADSWEQLAEISAEFIAHRTS